MGVYSYQSNRLAAMLLHIRLLHCAVIMHRARNDEDINKSKIGSENEEHMAL